MIAGGELGGDGVEQGRLELSFWEERETTEDLEKRPTGLEGTEVSLL
jgi:hypothetical protein